MFTFTIIVYILCFILVTVVIIMALEISDIQGQRVYDILTLIEKGIDTFGSYEEFENWLTTVNEIDSVTPRYYLRNKKGRVLLYERLDVIEKQMKGKIKS